jgi:hypothetical protein
MKAKKFEQQFDESVDITAIPDLEIHLPVIHICWRDWCCDRAIQARSLLNLLFVTINNKISQIIQNLKYRQSLGGRPMRWQLPNGGIVTLFL